MFYLFSGKSSTLGANSFLLEQTLFQNGLGVQKSKQKATKVVSRVKNKENLSSVSNLLVGHTPTTKMAPYSVYEILNPKWGYTSTQ